MNSWPIIRLTPNHPCWPTRLDRRLGPHAPVALDALGNLELLAVPRIALFCSVRCPGDALLAAYDRAAHWRDTGRGVISGFHSPVEKECLRILLRGPQPIIICPARALPMRLPVEWRRPLAAGGLLVLSCFTTTEDRVTSELALHRNELVAALADEIWFAHIVPGGELEKLAARFAGWPSTVGNEARPVSASPPRASDQRCRVSPS